jgi:hypothetical protein
MTLGEGTARDFAFVVSGMSVAKICLTFSTAVAVDVTKVDDIVSVSWNEMAGVGTPTDEQELQALERHGSEYRMILGAFW